MTNRSVYLATRLALICDCSHGSMSRAQEEERVSIRQAQGGSEARLHFRASPASPLGISPLVGLPPEPIDPGKRSAALHSNFASCASTTTPNSANAPRARSPKASSSAGFRGGWNGARARSGIVPFYANPRRADMKDILNAKIKRANRFVLSHRRFCARSGRRMVRTGGMTFPYDCQVFQVGEENARSFPPLPT